MNTVIVWAAIVVQGFSPINGNIATQVVRDNIATQADCQAFADALNAQHTFISKVMCVSKVKGVI